MSEPTFRVQLPKTGAEALVDLAYRNKRDTRALARLTLLLDGRTSGAAIAVEVDLTKSELEAVRRAAVAERAPNVAGAAKKAHDALTEFTTYRPGAVPTASRTPSQVSNDKARSMLALDRRIRTRSKARVIVGRSGQKKWHTTCDRCGWSRRSRTEERAREIAAGHRCGDSIPSGCAHAVLNQTGWIAKCPRCGWRQAAAHRSEAEKSALAHSCGGQSG